MIGFRISSDRAQDRFSLFKIVGGGMGILLLISILVGLWLVLSDGAMENVIVTAGIFAVMTIGYQVFVGNTGVVSFGHPALIAIGAYVAGLVSIPPEIKVATLPNLPPFLMDISVGLYPSLLLGGTAAALVALAIGPIIMRLTGATAGITTFGLLVITNEIIRNLDRFTRGTQTFFGVPKTATPTNVFIVVCIVAGLSLLYKFSSFGLRARAVRDDPLAAETSGINIVRARIGAWILSAFISGLSGALLAHHLTAFSPKSFFINMVVPVMVMCVLGGAGSVIGAVSGVIVISAWLELMRGVEAGTLLGFAFPSILGISQLSLGLVLILLLWLRPSGLWGSYETEVEFRTGQTSDSDYKTEK